MFVKGLRKFLYAGALLAVAPISAKADHHTAADACAPACPTTCKVKVWECVDEPYEYTKTVYKPVTVEETYTAYKCETVSETKTKQVTEYQKVCETVNETRTITKKVPCWEEKTVMQTKLTCVKVTEMVSRPKISTHWECVEKPALFSKCNPCDPCCTPCTRTVKKLVVDCTTECVPVCRTKIVKECVPVCKKVCTYKCVTETVCVPVTKVKCVPVCKTVTYTECKKVMVPYQAKRCVTKCVAENVVCKGVRKVAKCVEKEVPVVPCDPCAAPCCGKSLFGGLKFNFSKGCCSAPACGVAASCCN